MESEKTSFYFVESIYGRKKYLEEDQYSSLDDVVKNIAEKEIERPYRVFHVDLVAGTSKDVSVEVATKVLEKIFSDDTSSSEWFEKVFAPGAFTKFCERSPLDIEKLIEDVRKEERSCERYYDDVRFTYYANCM